MVLKNEDKRWLSKKEHQPASSFDFIFLKKYYLNFIFENSPLIFTFNHIMDSISMYPKANKSALSETQWSMKKNDSCSDREVAIRVTIRVCFHVLYESARFGVTMGIDFNYLLLVSFGTLEDRNSWTLTNAPVSNQLI